MDTTYKTPDGVFNYRVGAIILNGTKALMAHNKRYDQYYSIGGRAHFGESSEQAMLREIFEETGIQAEIDRLAIIRESFFCADGTPFHELSFFYLIKPFDFDKIDYSAIKCDGEQEEILWIDLADKEGIKGLEIFPLGFAEIVLNLPKEIKHIVDVEDNFVLK